MYLHVRQIQTNRSPVESFRRPRRAWRRAPILTRVTGGAPTIVAERRREADEARAA